MQKAPAAATATGGAPTAATRGAPMATGYFHLGTRWPGTSPHHSLAKQANQTQASNRGKDLSIAKPFRKSPGNFFSVTMGELPVEDQLMALVLNQLVQPEGSPRAERRNHSRPCNHEVVIPDGYTSAKDEAMHGTLENPAFHGEMAHKYPFQLDPFQSISIACLERNESVLVLARTPAGKMAIAEYAIAMSFRETKKIIYASPFKSLSNQMYRELSMVFDSIGLMTDDVTLHPEARCLVMTTEILRANLCSGSVVFDVGWVVFDGIHCLEHPESGIALEESIIFLPPEIKMIFLSAPMSNAPEFAEWICNLHRQPCHVVSTDFRPTALEHYVFPVGGSEMHLIIDEDGQLREDNFVKLQDTFTKQHNHLDERKGGGPKASGRIAKGGSASRRSNIKTIAKMIMERKLQPVIIWSSSRRECEHCAKSVLEFDFNTQEEKDLINVVFKHAIGTLKEEDRSLPDIELILPILQKGMAVHHSGLLPIMRELVELLFQEGLVKVLFATETFAMGINMLAQMIVFTSIKKWDGDTNRYIRSGEYTQLSGRAGWHGKDDNGMCVIMVDEKMEMSVVKEMVSGKLTPLISTFRLSYYTILKSVGHVEGPFTAEHVIMNSFRQFQYEKASPGIIQKIKNLENEVATLDSTGGADLAAYHKLLLGISELEKKIMSEMIKPERGYLVRGRLVKVRDGSKDWGWCVVASDVKKAPASQSLSPALGASCRNNYIVDMLVYCSSSSISKGPSSQPRPPRPEEKGEMIVVPMPLSSIYGLSRIIISIPELLPPRERQNILLLLKKVISMHPEGLPEPHPIRHMRIQDAGLVECVGKLEDLQQEKCSHPRSESIQREDDLLLYQRKAALNHEIQQLKSKLCDSQIQKFRDELENQLHVLKMLGHINSEGVVQLKGRAACLIESGDGLLITETLFNGTFNDLDHHQVASVASCFVPCDSLSKKTYISRELSRPMVQLMHAAKRIAEVQQECKLEVNLVEYVESSSRADLVRAIHCWSKGATFGEVIRMTGFFAGDVIRHAKRLKKVLNEMKAAAEIIGEANLAKKFELASESVYRGIMSAGSLYLQQA
ncbi:unnamed protein product [Urochloa humidicola]